MIHRLHASNVKIHIHKVCLVVCRTQYVVSQIVRSRKYVGMDMSERYCNTKISIELSSKYTIDLDVFFPIIVEKPPLGVFQGGHIYVSSAILLEH